MAQQPLSQLKAWFRKGLKPTEGQFWDTWDSFWHKEEKIPMSSIENLNATLNSKGDTQAFINLAQEVNQQFTELRNEINSVIGGFDPSDFHDQIENLNEQKQDKSDPNLQTEAKTVVAAINEVNGRINSVVADLEPGWNTVISGKLYPIFWAFLGKPFCFTAAGVPVDFRVRNMNNSILNDSHTFDIYVDVACSMHAATTPNDSISGVEIDHLIIEYFYEGIDGRDLDTVTELAGAGLELPEYTLGFQHDGNGTVAGGRAIVDNDGFVVAGFGGDNTGGGTGTNERYYETVYVNVARLRALSPDDDIEITLYGTWYSQRTNGFIHIGLQGFAGETPEFSNTQKRLSIGNLPNTFSSNGQIGCNISATVQGGTLYKTEYTPAFKIMLKANSDKIQIVQLS
ncbi:MAG: hypothetical protein LBR52_04685 [Prevotellaceae bacterium]|jgi:hypothetical protein|nr:hypothetical protein [Prevotellaceae bacterium]